LHEDIIWATKLRRFRWVGNTPHLEKRNVYRVSVGHVEETGHFEDLGINGPDLIEIGWDDMN